MTTSSSGEETYRLTPKGAVVVSLMKQFPALGYEWASTVADQIETDLSDLGMTILRVRDLTFGGEFEDASN